MEHFNMNTAMDLFFEFVWNAATTLSGYMLGAKVFELPKSAAILIAILFGVIGMANHWRALRKAVPAIFLLALAGCSVLPMHVDQMTPEQISAYAKMKDVSVMCIIANTPYGKATGNYLNLDKGVIPCGTLTVDDACKVTLSTVSCPPKP